MKPKWSPRFLITGLMSHLIVVSGNAFADGILPPPRKISDQVYAWIGPLEGPAKENQGYRMNMVVVLGKKAVAVVDTGYTETMAGEMLAHIRKISKVPVKYAINSNSQPHRFMGNPVFRKAGATIIAHEKSAARMQKQAGNFSTAIENILELKPGSVTLPKAPDKVISGDLDLDLGGITLKIRDFGQAHTPTQLVVEIKGQQVDKPIVYTGDLLYSGRLLAVLADSGVKSWLSGYERLKQFGNALLIPGHGEPAKLSAFDFTTRDYLQLLYSHMEKAVDEGTDIQDAINQLDQSAYSGLVNFEELSGRNASWTYLEAEKAAFE